VGVPSPPGEGGVLGLFDLKVENFGAVFKLDLTEETRTQLQEEEAIASSCLILATPMHTRIQLNDIMMFDLCFIPQPFTLLQKVDPAYRGGQPSDEFDTTAAAES